MLILLPPSEGKSHPEAADPVDLDSLAFAGALGEKRREALDALDPGLRKAPAAPAAEIYTGILFQRLRLTELPEQARSPVLIASFLWGMVAPGDRIPHYRFSPKTRLAGVGPPATYWRSALERALPDEEGELVVDMRSRPYVAAWKPKRATLLAVRAFTEKNGERKVVSHMAKAVRGEVAKALLEADEPPVDPTGAATIAESDGFRVEVGPESLDVIASP